MGKEYPAAVPSIYRQDNPNPCHNFTVGCFSALVSGWDYECFSFVFGSKHIPVPPPCAASKPVTEEAVKHVGDALVVEANGVKGGMTVTPAEDVGEKVVLECGTVQCDGAATAVLLNGICAALEKETGRTVSRVVHGTAVDASAPILSLQLKTSKIRCAGKSLTPADIPDIVRALTK